MLWKIAGLQLKFCEKFILICSNMTKRTLRTPESQEKYAKFLSERDPNCPCPLCSREAIQDFKNWKIIHSDFPYDRVSKINHMLVSKRHVTEENLNPEEWDEFHDIKSSYVNNNYDYILETVKKRKSLPDHFHIHLIVIDEI